MRLYFYIITLGFFFLYTSESHNCVAQTNSVKDSLLQLLTLEPTDSQRYDILISLIIRLRKDDAPTAAQYAEEAVNLAKKNAWGQRAAKSLAYWGVCEINQSEYEKAYEKLERALSQFQGLQDTLGITYCMQNLGNIHRNKGEYPKALEYQLRATELIEIASVPKSNLARAYMNTGNIYIYTEDYNNAVERYEKALKIWEQLNSPEDMANLYSNIGAMRLEMKDYKIAGPYLEKGLHLFDSLQIIYGIAATKNNLGYYYLNTGQPQRALSYTQEALQVYESMSNKAQRANALAQLGDIYAALNQTKPAINSYLASLAIAEERKLLDQQCTIQEKLAVAYAKTGQYQEAFNAQKQFSLLQDSILNAEKVEQVNELRTQYETEKKDQEIAILKQGQARQAKAKQRLSIGLSILLLLACIATFAWISRQKALKKSLFEQQQTQKLLQEKEKLLEQLKLTQQQLIRNEKLASLGQLTAGVAHEINNPINFVSSNIMALRLDFEEIQQLLKKVHLLKTKGQSPELVAEIVQMSSQLNTTYLSMEIDQLIKGIERGVKRTTDIVTSLKSFSNLTSEEFVLADINEIIASSLTILKGNMPKQIQLNQKLNPLPKVSCQIGRLQQVFVNIINNAIQATLADGGNISIQSVVEDHHIKITIQDDGIGMDESTLHRLFDPFFTTKGVGEGTGLGLSISYGIIEQHQGTISVESEVGKGSTFMINLPINNTIK